MCRQMQPWIIWSKSCHRGIENWRIWRKVLVVALKINGSLLVQTRLPLIAIKWLIIHNKWSILLYRHSPQSLKHRIQYHSFPYLIENLCSPQINSIHHLYTLAQQAQTLSPMPPWTPTNSTRIRHQQIMLGIMQKQRSWRTAMMRMIIVTSRMTRMTWYIKCRVMGMNSNNKILISWGIMKERNLEQMMISGGDYSPNSHTFFK